MTPRMEHDLVAVERSQLPMSKRALVDGAKTSLVIEEKSIQHRRYSCGSEVVVR
jgi:hypothetical protein